MPSVSGSRFRVYVGSLVHDLGIRVWEVRFKECGRMHGLGLGLSSSSPNLNPTSSGLSSQPSSQDPWGRDSTMLGGFRLSHVRLHLTV